MALGFILTALAALLVGVWIGRLGRGWVCVSCSEWERARKGDGERLPVRDELPGRALFGATGTTQPRPESACRKCDGMGWIHVRHVGGLEEGFLCAHCNGSGRERA